jgi:hypothetical protein
MIGENIMLKWLKSKPKDIDEKYFMSINNDMKNLKFNTANNNINILNKKLEIGRKWTSFAVKLLGENDIPKTVVGSVSLTYDKECDCNITIPKCYIVYNINTVDAFGSVVVPKSYEVFSEECKDARKSIELLINDIEKLGDMLKRGTNE